jgi:hypothetical protein
MGRQAALKSGSGGRHDRAALKSEGRNSKAESGYAPDSRLGSRQNSGAILSKLSWAGMCHPFRVCENGRTVSGPWVASVRLRGCSGDVDLGVAASRSRRSPERSPAALCRGAATRARFMGRRCRRRGIWWWRGRSGWDGKRQSWCTAQVRAGEGNAGAEVTFQDGGAGGLCRGAAERGRPGLSGLDAAGRQRGRTLAVGRTPSAGNMTRSLNDRSTGSPDMLTAGNSPPSEPG